jgi:hypothetical protein
MPERLGSSVEVSSSARAHLRQRMMATWTTGRDADSMLVRATTVELIVFEDGRSESDDEYDDEEDDVEDEDDTLPVYGTCGGRVAAVDIVGKKRGLEGMLVYLAI